MTVVTFKGLEARLRTYSSIIRSCTHPFIQVRAGSEFKWEIGKRLVLPVKKDSKHVELPLPLTLGNLELSRKEIQELQEKDGILTLTPTLYTANAHATYTLTDGVSVNGTTAHPSPPAPPSGRTEP